MALFIIDGVPGAGKTLNTIKEVRDRALSEARPVYYNYISQLSPSLGWHELTDDDIKNWHDVLPEGAILVIDEAWRHFPKWETKKQPPDYVLAFFQHRKKGHDVYLIVQSARVQIDPVVYENTEAHIHFQRIAGSTFVKRFEWNGTVGNPKAASSIATAKITTRKLDKSIFELYHSAEIHTHKFRPPWKYIAAFGLLVFCLGALFHNSRKAAESFASAGDSNLVSDVMADNPRGQPLPSSPPENPQQTGQGASLDLQYYQPRVDRMPWTAPVYDRLRQPVSYPRPAACIINEAFNDCQCYTQQATRLTVPDDFCRAHVAGGYFDDQIPDPRTGSVSLPVPP